MSSIRERTWTSGDKQKLAYVVDYRDQHGKRHVKTFKRKKDAEAWRTTTLYEVKQGTHTADSTSRTLAEAAALWLTRAETEKLERSTVEQYEGHINNHLAKSTLWHKRLSAITTPMIEDYKDLLLRAKSRAMAGKILASLKAILADAQRRGLVSQNVAAGVKMRKPTRDEEHIEVGKDVPTKEEARALVAAAESRWRPFFITAIFTGLRSSELRGLSWRFVDLDTKVIRVRERVDAWNQRGNPKSKAGRRDVPLAPVVVNTLREWKLACPKGELDLVFPNGVGRHESHANIYNRGFVPLQVKAGVVDADGKPKYSLHALRHFAASWFIDQGFTPKRVQTILGHSSITMTYDRYGHLFPDAEGDHEKLAAGELAIIG